MYLGIYDRQLRFLTPEAKLVPIPQEVATQQIEAAQVAQQQVEEHKQRVEQEKQRAAQEQQRAEQEKQRADRLAARLSELGIDPTQL